MQILGRAVSLGGGATKTSYKNAPCGLHCVPYLIVHCVFPRLNFSVNLSLTNPERVFLCWGGWKSALPFEGSNPLDFHTQTRRCFLLCHEFPESLPVYRLLFHSPTPKSRGTVSVCLDPK